MMPTATNFVRKCKDRLGMNMNIPNGRYNFGLYPVISSILVIFPAVCVVAAIVFFSESYIAKYTQCVEMYPSVYLARCMRGLVVL